MYTKITYKNKRAKTNTKLKSNKEKSSKFPTKLIREE